MMTFIMLGISSCDKSDVSNEENNNQLKKGFIRTDSPQPIRVKINNHILIIPKYYIAQGPKGDEFVSLRTNWPNLTSRFQLTADKSKPNRFDSMEILLHGSRMVRALRQGGPYKSLLGRSTLGKPVYNEKLELWEYRSKRFLELDSRVSHYVSHKKEFQTLYEQPLIIDCYGGIRIKNDLGSIQCQVDYLIRDDIALTYRFYQKHIKDWKLIDSKIRTMLESYIQE